MQTGSILRPSPLAKTQSTLPDDLKFLVACCKAELSQDDITIMTAFLGSEHLALSELIGLARMHGVIPLVYKTLRKLSEEIHNVQTPLLDAFKEAYMHVARRNMLMSAELLRIMKLLEESGIEALAFKGPVLAQLAYGDITMRQFGDLDILVREADIYTSARLIIDQNYDPMDSIEFLKNSAKLHLEKNYEFYGRKNGIKVEIHWRLINEPFLKKFKNYDAFASQASVDINSKNLPTLDTTILLLYLCNHGASHMWERLEWIADIDRTVRSLSADMNWQKSMELAHELQSKTTFLLGLGLSGRLFKTPLPASIETEIEQEHVSELIAFVLETLGTDLISKDHTSHEKNMTVYRFHLALQDSVWTKTGMLLQTLFGYSSGDVMKINLPRSLFFLYYLIRIVRIFGKYVIAPSKKLFSNALKFKIAQHMHRQ